MEIVIYLDCRGPRARPDTLNFFQREQPVSRFLLMTDAKLFPAMIKNFFAAAQHATDVGADLHVILSHRLGVQQRIVADHVAHLQFSQIGLFCQIGNGFVGQVPNFVLRVQQHGDKEGAPCRVLLDLLVEELIEFLRDNHLSVYFTQHNIYASDGSNYISYQLTFAHFVQRLQVGI
jgi:hypothetical protein